VSLPNELNPILAQNGGTFTTAQANAAGVSNERLRLLVKADELERAAFGVYVLPEVFVDKMYVEQQRRPKIIYSHDTALFLHDLTDRDPIGYSVTVPSGYNTARLKADGFMVFTINRELHEIGVSQVKTIFGHTVTAYSMERAICDCLRSRSQMDPAVVIDAIKRYAKRKDKSLNMLMKMGETFRVTKLLRNYMEVLV